MCRNQVGPCQSNHARHWRAHDEWRRRITGLPTAATIPHKPHTAREGAPCRRASSAAHTAPWHAMHQSKPQQGARRHGRAVRRPPHSSPAHAGWAKGGNHDRRAKSVNPPPRGLAGAQAPPPPSTTPRLHTRNTIQDYQNTLSMHEGKLAGNRAEGTRRVATCSTLGMYIWIHPCAHTRLSALALALVTGRSRPTEKRGPGCRFRWTNLTNHLWAHTPGTPVSPSHPALVLYKRASTHTIHTNHQRSVGSRIKAENAATRSAGPPNRPAPGIHPAVMTDDAAVCS